MPILTKIRSGELEGREKDGALLFAGIPYAAPPVGRRRFRPPEPHEGWPGVRAAKRFGPAAPQPPGRGLTQTALRWDEDCLTLNVCTPALDDRARPVLVWIHGGGFRTGKGGIPWYNGASFARRGDVVTVTLNYRLGALGFAHLPDVGGDAFGSSGLTGLLDQLAALTWVQENIAAFGGDPARVTIAGESAGGMSVGALLGCPAAAGLFQGAIAQSGAAHHTLPDAKARALGRELARELGAGSVDAMQARPVAEILDAQLRVERTLERRGGLDGTDGTGVGGLPFQPVVEGRVLPRRPLDAIRAGAAADVAVMVGSNLDETTLWGYGEVDEARLERIASRHFPDPGAALATYRAGRPDASPEALLIALTTDYLFRIPAIRLAEAQLGSGGSAYQYLFTWRSRAFGGRLGATHALEIPFAFHTLEQPGVAVFLGEGPLPRALADAMHAAWIAFIRTGSPNAEGLPPWPAYDLERRPVMEFGERVGVLSDPLDAERRAWDGLR